jgi:hypothetical protein
LTWIGRVYFNIFAEKLEEKTAILFGGSRLHRRYA